MIAFKIKTKDDIIYDYVRYDDGYEILITQSKDGISVGMQNMLDDKKISELIIDNVSITTKKDIKEYIKNLYDKKSINLTKPQNFSTFFDTIFSEEVNQKMNNGKNPKKP